MLCLWIDNLVLINTFSPNRSTESKQLHLKSQLLFFKEKNKFIIKHKEWQEICQPKQIFTMKNKIGRLTSETDFNTHRKVTVIERVWYFCMDRGIEK